MNDRFSRRRFLAGSLEAGIGAAVLGAGGLSAGALLEESLRAPALAASAITVPAEPKGARSWVSRPDLHPPVVNVNTVPGTGTGVLEPKYVFVAPRAGGGVTYPAGVQPGLMILERNGGVVWFEPLTATDDSPFNFDVQTYKGKSVLTWFQGTVGPADYGVGGTCVLADSSYAQIAAVTGSPADETDLHEFQLTSEGTALITVYEKSTADDVVICHAQEVDIATNDVVFDWACYPTVPTSASYVSTTGDYFHMNSIDLWPGSARNLLISSRQCSAVYLIDRATKGIIWQLGGKASKFKSFTRVGDDTRFEFQHHARALSDGSGLSLFDDATPPSPEKQSWGKVFSLDQSTMRATLRHQYNHTTAPIDAGSQGSCQLLPNGGHFIGWGAEPYFSEFAASGSAVEAAMILDGRFENGVNSYRAFMYDWTGTPPASDIALVVRPGSATGSFIAYVSWNGATEVDTWRISAGTSSSNLTEVAAWPKGSFETLIRLTKSGATEFEATAHDASGAVLGTSQVVQAT